MAVYVLIHGGNMSTDTWNRIAKRNDYPPGGYLGNKYWAGTVAELSAQNHVVFSPGLNDENICNLSDHIDQVCNLILENELNRIILTGHSYGGMVITGVAAKIKNRIRRLVYLDAALPDPGQSLFDLLNLGLAGTSGEKPILPDPAPPYVEKLQFDPGLIESIPKTYIRCTNSEFREITLLAEQKISVSPLNWNYFELQSSHFPMADMPEDFYSLLLVQSELH